MRGESFSSFSTDLGPSKETASANCHPLETVNQFVFTASFSYWDKNKEFLRGNNNLKNNKLVKRGVFRPWNHSYALMKQAHNCSTCTLILFTLLLMFNLISIHSNIHCSTSGQEETEFGTAIFWIAESPESQNTSRTGNVQVLSEDKAEELTSDNTSSCCAF